MFLCLGIASCMGPHHFFKVFELSNAAVIQYKANHRKEHLVVGAGATMLTRFRRAEHNAQQNRHQLSSIGAVLGPQLIEPCPISKGNDDHKGSI